MSPHDLILKHFRPTPAQREALDRLKLFTLADILFYLPSRLAQPGSFKRISDCTAGETVTIYAKVKKIGAKKGWKSKIPMTTGTLEDESGKIKVLWFNQAYMAKKVPEGTWATFTGKVSAQKEELAIINPDINGGEKNTADTLFKTDNQSGLIIPVYPETRNLSSGWFYYHAQELLKNKVHEQLVDPLPPYLLKKYKLPSLSTALVWLHSPKKAADAEAARKRFAFTEILGIQINRLNLRQNYQKTPAYHITVNKKSLKEFTERLSFPLTKAQERAVSEILTDLGSDKPMTRLLEGDVGSGKTAVAALAAFMCVASGKEVAYMAPTEILARQHFESFIKFFDHLNTQVGLLTGHEARKYPSKVYSEQHTHISKPTLLKWVAGGQIPVLVGTHSLIQKQVKWRDLGLVIIDEQHRFGIMQRGALAQKGTGGHVPHLLSMTATPIPRTLALTIYGDLDLSVLDEMPAGRQGVKTTIVAKKDESEMYKAIENELKAGRQAFVICPRIEEPDPSKAFALMTKSAKLEAKRLAEKVFPRYSIGLLHSKMKPKEKEEVMADFESGKTTILVATSVVEVGINVPNATVIIIEGAERFGLSQLHQLRGRVMRSSHLAHCYLRTDTANEKSHERLKALVTAKNGFELAELDLSLRGAGSLTGTSQWGISDIAMEALKNLRLVEAARTEAKLLLQKDPTLKSFPALQKYLHQENTLHLE